MHIGVAVPMHEVCAWGSHRSSSGVTILKADRKRSVGGLGFRLSLDKQREQAEELLLNLADRVDRELAQEILRARQLDEADIYEQRLRVQN